MDGKRIQPWGYSVDELTRSAQDVHDAMPSVDDIQIPHIPYTPGELALFLLHAPDEVIREMADDARRTGVAPFGSLCEGRHAHGR